MPEFIVTNHARKRYYERFERCRRADAEDRIKHAASIARIATARQVAWGMANARMIDTGGLNLWCEVETMLLHCLRVDGVILIKTVRRVPSDAAIRATGKQMGYDRKKCATGKHASRRGRLQKQKAAAHLRWDDL